jgi:glycosyltransferase involved in cell wall biosynthesis
MKVVIITDMLPPYRLSFFSALASRCDLTILVDCAVQKDRNWKPDDRVFPFHTLILDGPAFRLTRKRLDVAYEESRQFHFSPGVFKAMCKIKPDIVITAEMGFRTLWALLYAKLFRRKLILWSEGTLHTEGNVGWIKQCVRPLLVRCMNAYWTNGPESTALIESYGGKQHLVTEAMTGIDTNSWQTERDKWVSQRQAIRDEYGIIGLTIVVNGSISARKGIKQMMAAFDRWHPNGPVTLVLLGSGELEHEVREWAARQKIFRVLMPGFLDSSEIACYVAAADWGMLPSLDDNWPLATLEILCCGLPQLFSIHNGATSDLCVPGVTGYAFDPLDLESFINALEQMEVKGSQRVPHQVVERLSKFYSPDAQATRAMASFACLEHSSILPS